MVRTEQQGAGGCAELLHPVDAQVALGRFGLDQTPFGFFDAFEYRSCSAGILVDAGGEVDLGLGRVTGKGLVEPEYGIRWCGFELLEHHGVLWSSFESHCWGAERLF